MKDKHCSCLKMSDKTLLKKVKAQMKSQFGKKARLSKVNKKCILCLCPYNQMMDIKNKKNASKKTVSKRTKALKGGQKNNKSKTRSRKNNKNKRKDRNSRKANRVHRGGSGNCGIVGTQKPCGSIVNVGQYLRPASYLPLDGPNHHVKNNLE